MSKHTTIELSKASMPVYRVEFEEFEGDGLVFTDFEDESEALSFWERIAATGFSCLTFEELGAMR